MHTHNKYSARGKGLSNLPKIFTSIQYKIFHSNKIHLPLYFFSIIPRYTFNDTLSSLYYSTNNFKKKKKKNPQNETETNFNFQSDKGASYTFRPKDRQNPRNLGHKRLSQAWTKGSSLVIRKYFSLIWIPSRPHDKTTQRPCFSRPAGWFSRSPVLFNS